MADLSQFKEEFNALAKKLGVDEKSETQVGDVIGKLRAYLPGRTGVPGLVPNAPLTAWIAAGFTLVVAIATYFGLSSGALFAVVRANPIAALGVFLLVGGAVTLAMLAPAVEAGSTMPEWAFALMIGLPLILVAWVTPDLPSPLSVGIEMSITQGSAIEASPAAQEPTGGVALLVLLSIAILLISGAAWLKRGELPGVSWYTAIVLAAMTFLSCGLWTVTKLAVMDRMQFEKPVVSSSLLYADGQRKIELTASGAGLAGPVRVAVLGDRGETNDKGQSTYQTISDSVLSPTHSGDLSGQLSVTIPGADWKTLRVVSCQEWETADKVTRCDRVNVQAIYMYDQARPGIGASLAPNADSTKIAYYISGEHFPPGSRATVTLASDDGGTRLSAQLIPSSGGAISWTGEVKGAPGMKWSVVAEVCTPDLKKIETCETRGELATLTIPASKSP